MIAQITITELFVMIIIFIGVPIGFAIRQKYLGKIQALKRQIEKLEQLVPGKTMQRVMDNLEDILPQGTAEERRIVADRIRYKN